MNSRSSLAILTATATLAVLAACHFRSRCDYSRGASKINQPGQERRLIHMDESSGEQAELYEYSERRDRMLRVVFLDGWTGVRTTNDTGKVTSLSEINKDGSLKLVYELNPTGAEPISLTGYRKDGTKCWFEKPVGAVKGVREIYQADGATLKACLRIDDNETVFAVFDELGEKQYEEVVPEQAPTRPEDAESGPPDQFETLLVYNGGVTPLYRQNLRQPRGQSAFYCESVDEFETGSWQVRRRITPAKDVTIDGKSITLTEVIIISEGHELYVRYCDKERCVRKMIDKTVAPAVTTEVPLEHAPKEDIDLKMFESPETPTTKQLARELMSTKRLGHMARLLKP